MSDSVRWALFHRFENGIPVEFFEIRQHRETVWTCNGQTKTFGTSEVLNAENAEESQEIFDRLVSDVEQKGLIETASGAYQPGQFDFAALTDAVKTASRLAFECMVNRHGDEQVCGFGLLTDECPMTIVPVGQSESAVGQAEEQHQAEARWFVGEWSFDDGNEHFDIPYRMILRQSREDIPFEQVMDDDQFAAGCFEAFVSALEALRSEGAFDKAGKRFVLLVNVNDSDEIAGMAERLNTDPDVLDGYRRVMG